MEDVDDKIALILAKVKESLKQLLTTRKIVGKYAITVEVNMSQGTPGDIYILKNSRERL